MLLTFNRASWGPQEGSETFPFLLFPGLEVGKTCQFVTGEGPQLGQGSGSSPGTYQLWVILGKLPNLSEFLQL